MSFTDKQLREKNFRRQKIKSEIAKARYKIRKNKEKKDLKENFLLNEKIKKLKKEDEKLYSEVKGVKKFEFRNKTITVKKSYLKKLKNPDKYILGVYERSTKKDIDKMRKNNDSRVEGLETIFEATKENYKRQILDIHEEESEEEYRGTFEEEKSEEEESEEEEAENKYEVLIVNETDYKTRFLMIKN